jgi:hypothetical protein
MDAVPAVPAEMLTLQEALRTLGNGLEASQVRRARVEVSAAGAFVEASGEYGRRRYSWDDLASQSRAQQAQRRPAQRAAPWMDPWALRRWSVLLRVAGLLLDAQGVRDCCIEATVHLDDPLLDFDLEATADGRPVLDAEAVRNHIQWLRLRRGTNTFPTEEPPPTKRPWWAPWRRA